MSIGGIETGCFCEGRDGANPPNGFRAFEESQMRARNTRDTVIAGGTFDWILGFSALQKLWNNGSGFQNNLVNDPGLAFDQSFSQIVTSNSPDYPVSQFIVSQPSGTIKEWSFGLGAIGDGSNFGGLFSGGPFGHFRDPLWALGAGSNFSIRTFFPQTGPHKNGTWRLSSTLEFLRANYLNQGATVSMEIVGAGSSTVKSVIPDTPIAGLADSTPSSPYATVALSVNNVDTFAVLKNPEYFYEQLTFKNFGPALAVLGVLFPGQYFYYSFSRNVHFQGLYIGPSAPQ